MMRFARVWLAWAAVVVLIGLVVTGGLAQEVKESVGTGHTEPVEEHTSGVDEWTPSDVAAWVRSLSSHPDFDTYSQSFKRIGINGHNLFDVSDKILRNDIHVPYLLHRDRILQSIDSLRLRVSVEPKNFWEYRTVHRLRASALLSGLFNCPRVTLLYVWVTHPEAQEWFDSFWDSHLALAPASSILHALWAGLSLLLMLMYPKLFLAHHSWKYFDKHPILVYLLNVSAGADFIDKSVIILSHGLPQWCRATFKHEWNGLLIVCVQLILYPITPWIITDFIFYSSLFRFLLNSTAVVLQYNIDTDGHFRAGAGRGFEMRFQAGLDNQRRHFDAQIIRPRHDDPTPNAPAPPVHFPAPLNVPERVLTLLDTPEDFLCPITHELMRLPTMTPTGQTYDYEAIAKWVQIHKDDPQTKRPLAFEQLAPNLLVRNLIARYVEDKEKELKSDENITHTATNAEETAQEVMEKIVESAQGQTKLGNTKKPSEDTQLQTEYDSTASVVVEEEEHSPLHTVTDRDSVVHSNTIEDDCLHNTESVEQEDIDAPPTPAMDITDDGLRQRRTNG